MRSWIAGFSLVVIAMEMAISPTPAWRESVEESGIEDLWIYPRVIDVDIHGIPALGGEPAHDHLDIRFLVMTDPDNTPIISEESKDVRWFSFEELETSIQIIRC